MPTTLPSHSAMMTSLYPREMGLLGNHLKLAPEADTLAERLKAAGFATAALISAIPLAAETGFNQGFDEYFCPVQSEQRAPRMRQRAGQWLEQNKDKRFFLFLHLFDPHAPYQPPDDLRGAFDVPTNVRLPPASEFKAGHVPADVRAASINAYDAEIRFADARIGAVLDDLDRLGLREKTVVVFVSDHGETLDELCDAYKYGFDHGEFLYPREIRIPMIVRLPEAMGLESAGGVHDAQVSTLDLMPTLLELLGVPCLSPYQGISLVETLRGNDGGADRMVVVQRHAFPAAPNAWMKGDEFAILHGGLLAIESDGRGPGLFDLTADPMAVNDLHAERRAEYDEMIRALDLWRGMALPGKFGASSAVSEEQRNKLQETGYLDGAG
jgi:arylsulfatase A-like enzyme